MALRLTRDAGGLIDPFGGQRDLERGLVRVLHEASFRDDATRLLRAVRYAERLRFKIEASTAAWLQRDLGYLDAVSGDRLRRELVFMLQEERVVDVTVLARDLGVLHAVHPALQLSNDVAARWREASGLTLGAPRDDVGLCVLLGPANEDAAFGVVQRLRLAARQQRALLDLVRLESLSSKLAAAPDDSVAVVSLLDGAVLPALRALAIRHGGPVAEACETYFKSWRLVRPQLRGDDIIALGVSPGPAVGEVLKMLRTERLQGRVETREEEIELVRHELMTGEK
jgi:tRNA nucleotidyltransferase (CCA-adding enzyme)